MSCPILFIHDGWQVLTSSWSAASKNGRSVQICYAWSQGGIGWSDNSTGTERTEIDIPFSVFVKYVAHCVRNGEIATFTEANMQNIFSIGTTNEVRPTGATLTRQAPQHKNG